MKIVEKMPRGERLDLILHSADRALGQRYLFGSDIDWSKAHWADRGVPETFDCSSLVQWCFRFSGIFFNEERSTILQAAALGRRILKLTNLKPGDLIFFDGERGYYRRDLFKGEKIDIGHVAIFIGNGKIIHADGGQKSVVEELLSEVVKRPNRKVTYMKRYF